MTNLDNEWENFLTDGVYNTDDKDKLLSSEINNCSDLNISTKTKITYLDDPIDLSLFWALPIISYISKQNGIIKKQMKFTCNTREEYEKLQQNQKDIKCLYVNVIKNIDDPTGHTKFKYVCKINVGISKKIYCVIKPKVNMHFTIVWF